MVGVAEPSRVPRRFAAEIPSQALLERPPFRPQAIFVIGVDLEQVDDLIVGEFPKLLLALLDNTGSIRLKLNEGRHIMGPDGLFNFRGSLSQKIAKAGREQCLAPRVQWRRVMVIHWALSSWVVRTSCSSLIRVASGSSPAAQSISHGPTVQRGPIVALWRELAFIVAITMG